MKILILILSLFTTLDCVKIQFKFYDDYLYQTSITIGNSTKNMRVLLDFTSTQLWFFATNATNSSTYPFLEIKKVFLKFL